MFLTKLRHKYYNFEMFFSGPTSALVYKCLQPSTQQVFPFPKPSFSFLFNIITHFPQNNIARLKKFAFKFVVLIRCNSKTV